MDADSRDRAARFWNEVHLREASGASQDFLSHPLVQTYISLRAFGTIVDPMRAVTQALRERTAPGDRVLSLGCGMAGRQRMLAEALPDRRFVGLDIADDVVRDRNAALKDEGLGNLRLEHGDFDRLELDPDSIQVLLGLGVFHHVTNLEGLWEQVRRGLAPGGVVLAQEYVGPTRFQWSDAQIEAGNRALREIVPEEHKAHHREVVRLPEQHWIDIDPSEAVRSAEIGPTLRAAGYELDAWIGGGCGLLQPCLIYQIHMYDPRNWQHNLVLARLFAEEARLMDEGVLEDEIVLIVARP